MAAVSALLLYINYVRVLYLLKMFGLLIIVLLIKSLTFGSDVVFKKFDNIFGGSSG